MRGRWLLVGVGVEGGLALVAFGWIGWRDLPLTWGSPGLAFTLGGLTAGVSAVVNIALLRLAPPLGPVESLRRVYREILQPLFGDLSTVGLLTLSVAAGVGEELMFRGVLQVELGWLPATLLFGALHWGGRGTLAFAVGATALGGLLGGLVWASGGLLAPIVAHAIYDALVLAYIRREAQAERGRMRSERSDGEALDNDRSVVAPGGGDLGSE